MGRPGADVIVDHGISFLWSGHRDSDYAGYYWGVGYDGPLDPIKQAYGHAFVLLAASSAKVAGRPGADRLPTDISTIIRERFWEEQYGAVAEEFTHEWGCSKQQAIQRVHMPERIAKLIIGGHATADGWRVPEHFMKKWLQIGLMQAVQCFGPVARHWGTR
jgi:sulfoquinovose isomerase